MMDRYKEKHSQAFRFVFLFANFGRKLTNNFVSYFDACLNLLLGSSVFLGWKVSTRSLQVTLQDRTIGMLDYCGLRYVWPYLAKIFYF